VAGLTLFFGIASIGLAVAVLVQRYRHTGALGRQQTLVFAVAFVPPIAAFVASFSDSGSPLLFGVASIPAVVHADGLLASVRVAQERLVLAREEERRRLRRDLHDGLGPALAGLTLQVDTIAEPPSSSTGSAQHPSSQTSSSIS